MSPKPQTLETRIKAEAKRLGFALCGIAAPETGEAYARHEAWVASGKYAGMSYLARPDALAKRKDPGLLLENCKSVLCLGLPYPFTTLSDEHGEQDLFGTIATYARLPDYHGVMRDKLETLGETIAEFIASEHGHELAYYIAVDSSAVLEKALAQKAGLGLLGKNSLLWNETYGTWFFLGELLLDFPLEPDLPLEGDFCSDCDICVRACPTGALCGDGTLDAGKCLSYLSIEYRGAIPLAYRRAMGQQVFGCDICQIVCPQNAPVLPSDFEYAIEPNLEAKIDLLAALELNETDFKSRYGHSALARAKHQGFRRNVIIALGNSADTNALSALRTALEQEKDPLCRESMQWAIETLQKSLSGLT